jgi:glycosyltransferase involved in cell wall biosynthesis
MRITIVQGAFLPVPPILGGAVEKIWSALGKEFARRGHYVTHISRQHHSLMQEELVDGVNHVRVPGFDTPASLVTLKWQDLVYSRRVLKVLPEADVLVTNTFWLPILAPQAGKGKIYVHVQRYPKGQMRLYGRAARLQTVSTVIRKAICREVPDLTEKVTVIPNFVPVAEAASESVVRSKCILYVGRIHPEKGTHLLIDAFARFLSAGFHDWKLRLVGPWEVAVGGGGATYYQRLRQQSRDIQNWIDWIGPVFDAQRLRSHYKESSIFVYPSLAGRGEASPVAPLEAMAEGCPPIVSSLECFRDYLQPRYNGWTFDECPDQGAANLADTLSEVVSDGAVLEQVRNNAIHTSQSYALPRIADRYLEDFQEL